MSKGKELAVSNAKDLTQVDITAEDIKNYFCPLATEKEVFMALGVIKSCNLNPHKKEVHLVKYSQKDKLSIIVGYEVYLKRAERSGKLSGWEAGTSEDGTKAWVKIWRRDWDRPFYWDVVLSEFNKGHATWKTIKSFMGKKVAIAQGFRLCFSIELDGMPYTKEEHQVFNINGGNKIATTTTKPNVEMPEEIEDAEIEELKEKTKPVKKKAVKKSKSKSKSEPEPEPEELFEKEETEELEEQPKKKEKPIDNEIIKKIHVLAGRVWGKDFDEPYKEKLFVWAGKDTSKDLSLEEGKAVVALLATALNKKMQEDK